MYMNPGFLDEMNNCEDYESFLVYEEMFKSYVDTVVLDGMIKDNRWEFKEAILRNRKKWLSKQLFFFQAIKEIIELFCLNEIGTECELDYEAIANYLVSDRFHAEHWLINDKETIYKQVTDDILNGLPVWKFLKISDKKRKIIESELKNQEELEHNKYLCYSCRYHHFNDPKSKYDDLSFYNGFSYINECKNYAAISKDDFNKDEFPKVKCKYYRERILPNEDGIIISN